MPRSVPPQLRTTTLATLAALAVSGCYVDAYAVIAKQDVADDGTQDTQGQDTDGQDSTGLDTGAALDLPDEGEALPAGACRPVGLDGPLPCSAKVPTTTIEPSVAWQWFGQDGETSVLVSPLVANLDDDNESGEVDLCDQPDIVVIAVAQPEDDDAPLPPGHVYILDGASGSVVHRFEHPVEATINPVLADLDGDHIPEIVATTGEPDNLRAIAFDASGEVLWESPPWSGIHGGLAIADLDLDGSAEVITPGHVLSAEGELLWAPAETADTTVLPVPVDLDLDGDLELVYGRNVYDHSGALVLELDVPDSQEVGVLAVANFDEDDEPEIFVQSLQYRVFEHDGTLKATCGAGAKAGPATLADIDGDGTVEIIGQRNDKLSAVHVDNSCTSLAAFPVDADEPASGMSFDLDGDGEPETLILANGQLTVLDGAWLPIASLPEPARASALTLPIVVDADNDGAAEILVVGSQPEQGGAPAVELIQNADDRFAPTRRIWNQHAYFGTNILEDGQLPEDLAPHWLVGANSFRSNLVPDYEGQACQGFVP